MSNFKREITDFARLEDSINTNSFLEKVNENLIKCGRAFLAFRNNEATVYYNGNQLCNLSASDGYNPSIYNHYLPIARSRTLRGELSKVSFLENVWAQTCNACAYSFSQVYEEILDNIEKEESPESYQASRFYSFSPLNQKEDHEIVLLDIEAAFAQTGKKTDRIDLVFYHTKNRQLMFIEVKRLSDNRLKPQRGKTVAEVIGQLAGYKNRCENEASDINCEYNKVISYYNALSGRNLPLIAEDSKPILGLLLVEFGQNEVDKATEVKNMLKDSGFKSYAIGDTSRVTDATLRAIYKAVK